MYVLYSFSLLQECVDIDVDIDVDVDVDIDVDVDTINGKWEASYLA